MIGCMCFNSRTCEGATARLLRHDTLKVVSIHAPVKVRPLRPQLHTPAQGFNSRTCEGATGGMAQLVQDSSVSIHAPVKVRLLGLH